MQMPEQPELTAGRIKAQARSLGFSLCGIAAAGAFPELRFLREWLDRGYAGEMRYMERTADRRADVRQVLPDARAVIALATNYNVDRPYSVEQADPGRARISRYAWGADYHEVVGGRTAALLDWMRGGEPGAVRGAAVRRHRTGPGAGLRAARRPRLGRQEQLPDQRTPRFLAVPVGDHLHAAAGDRSAGAGPVRYLFPLPGGVPHRGDCRAAGDRWHPLPVVSDDRGAGGARRVGTPRDRQPRLRLRRLPGRVPVERAGGGIRRSRLAAAPGRSISPG